MRDASVPTADLTLGGWEQAFKPPAVSTQSKPPHLSATQLQTLACISALILVIKLGSAT